MHKVNGMLIMPSEIPLICERTYKGMVVDEMIVYIIKF